MRWVASPAQTPQRCAFLPTIQGYHPKGFIEGTELWGGDRAYISMEAVEQIATALGWVPKQAIVAADENRVSRLERELGEARERCDVLQQQLDAVEVLRNGGSFRQQKAGGRPPKQKAVA